MINMKRKGGLNIHLSNKLSYTLIAILILVAVGVYALVPGVTPNPGHDISGISPPSPCSSPNNFLKFDGTNWICSSANITETDPTVPVSLKDGIQCSYSLNNCQDLSAVNGWTQCPSGKIAVGVYVPCPTTYVCRLASIRCCSISISCS